MICLLFRFWLCEKRSTCIQAAHLSFAFSPRYGAARPRSERSAGGPVFSCLNASSVPSLWRAPRAGQLIICAAREGLPFICLSALFAPVMARGLSLERTLRRRPSYHSPFVSFAQLYGARPERAYLSFAFLLYLPPLWRVARSWSERSVGGPVSICLLFRSPTFMARGPNGPAYLFPFCSTCPRYGTRPVLGASARFAAQFSFASCFICPPLYGARPERASLSFAFLLYLPPLWYAARPRSERFAAQFSFAHRYGARPELLYNGARPERAS